MKKKFISLTLVFLLVFCNSILFSAMLFNTDITRTNRNEIFTGVPKTSSYPVTKLWDYSLEPSAIYEYYNEVVMSADGEYIAISHDENVTVFHRSSKIPLWSYNTTEIVRSIAISEDGQYLAVGTGAGMSNPGHIYLFDTTANYVDLVVWSNYTGDTVYAIAISRDGGYIAATVGAYLYYFNNTKPVGDKEPMWEYFMSGVVYNNDGFEMSSDGTYIAMALSDNSLRLVNNTKSASKTPEWTVNLGDSIYEISMSSDGNYIALNSNYDKIYFYNTTMTGTKIPEWTFDDFQTFRDIDISSDGRYLVISTNFENHTVYYFDTSTNIPQWFYNGSSSAFDFNPAAISGDGEYIVASHGDDLNLCLLNKTSETNKTYFWVGPQMTNMLKKVVMSTCGRYFLAVNTSWSHDNIMISLFYNAIPHDTGNGQPVIPLGDYFLPFMFLSIVLLIFTTKKKFNQN